MAFGGLVRSLHKLFDILKDIGEGNELRDIRQDPDVTVKGNVTTLMSRFIITPTIFVDEQLRYMDKRHFKNLIKTELKLFAGMVVSAYRILVELMGMNPLMVARLMSKPSDLISFDTARRLSEIANEDSVSEILLDDTRLSLDFIPSTESVSPRKYYGLNGERINDIRTNELRDTFKPDTDMMILELQINVSGRQNGQNFNRIVRLPLIIYPLIKYIDAESLVKNMLDSNFGKTFLERYWDLRAGAISLMDFIFASDLVKKYKEKKITNENAIANELNKLDKSIIVKDILYNTHHFSRNFNIYIFEESLRVLIESELRGSLFKNKNKEKMMDDLMAFSVTFVDNEKEQVTIFIDDVPGFSVLNFNMLASDKKSDVAELAELFLKNQQPF